MTPHLPADHDARGRVRGPDPITVPVAGDGADFDPDTSMVVQAGAGSGKTSALVDRMVALVRSGVKLQQMAAITFTVRAAGEMRFRFFERLREVAGELDALEVLPDRVAARDAERMRVREAAASVEDLFVDTIHTFCRTLLAERPFEAGVPPDFRVVDDREEAEMRQRFWHEHLRRELRHGRRSMEDWERLGIDPGSLSGFFGARCTHEDLPLAPGRPDPPDLAPVVTLVAAWLDRALPATPAAAARRDDLTDALRRADRYRRLVAFDTPGRQATFLGWIDGLVDGDGEVKGQKVGFWKDAGPASEAMLKAIRGKAKEPVIEPLGPLVLDHVRPALTAWKEYLYGEVGSFIDGAVDAYRDYRCAEGLLTFQDLLLRAAHLLRHHPPVRRHFRRRYRHVLVDEFQDTDPVQAEVVFLLTADDPEVTDWTASRPGDGALFLVGDDKQSIYRFRRADVQVFRQARDLIEAGGGSLLRFTANFRSERRICEWVNRAVAPSFAGGEPYQAAWEDLQPYLPAGDGQAPVLVLDLDKVHRNQGRDMARAEAAHVAALIEGLMDGRTVPTTGAGPVSVPGEPWSYGDFLVLLRTATHAVEYTRALDAAGVPYVVSGGKSLGKEPVIRAVLDLLEAAFDPDNPVALLAVLRGTFVGASDEDLRRFRAAGGSFRVDAGEQAPAGPGTLDPVHDGMRLVGRVRELFTGLPVGEATAQALDECGLLPGMAVREDGSSSGGALLRLLDIARALDGQGGGWIELMDELRRLDRGELEAESQTLEAGGPAVRIMTVHQAKGLQARVVFLAFPADSREHPVAFHVDRSGDGPVLYLPCRDGRTDLALPAGWARAEAEARRFEEAEELRLVYVAATRARELVVVARYPDKLAGPWSPLYDHLDGIPVIDTAALHAARVTEPQEPNQLNGLLERHAATHEALDTASRPGYRQDSVTGAVDGEASDVFAAESAGLGRGFGRAVHRMMQLVVERRRSPLDEAALRRVASRLVAEEVTSASRETLRSMTVRAVEAVKAFLAGPVPVELADAARVHCELPVVLSEPTPEGPAIRSGVVDLAYRLPDGWVIVDYKTDAADAAMLRERYAAQLAAYRAQWEAITGEPVIRTVIWPAVPGARDAIACP